ncbi:MAG: Transposase IS4 family protein [Bacillota bacterium]|nr:MAG: Transposase IS4 family protein [Bacillota bacterium]
MPAQIELQTLVVRPIQPEEETRWNRLMSEHHYLGFRTLVGESMKYVAEMKQHYMDYEGMVNIVKNLEALSTSIMTFRISGIRAPLFSARTHSQASVTSVGVGAGYGKLSGLTIREGRFLEEGDEGREVCVISENIASRLQVRVLDRVTYAGRELEVVGIVADRKPFDVSFQVSRDQIYLPVALKRELSAASLTNDLVPYVRANLVFPQGSRDLLYEELKEDLRHRFGHSMNYAVLLLAVVSGVGLPIFITETRAKIRPHV